MKKNTKSARNGSRKNRAGVIASRKTCDIEGIGLSHYILVEKKSR